MILLIIILGIICVGICYNRFKGDQEGVLYWRELFRHITDFAFKHYSGTPTRVVLSAIYVLGSLLGVSSIGYPICRAFIQRDANNGFWKIFIECQWDNVNIWLQLVVAFFIAIICVAYFVTNKKNAISQEDIDNIKKSTSDTKKIAESNKQTLDSILTLLKEKNSDVIKSLLPNFRNDIIALKVNTAYKHLIDIKGELEKESSTSDISLKALVQYYLGMCAKYQKGKKCTPHFSSAYSLMKQSNETIPEIVEGMIYVACKQRNEAEARQYADELKRTQPLDYWTIVPELVFTKELNKTYESLPNTNKLIALANALVIGWNARVTEMGIDVKTFELLELNDITFDNFPLWVLNLSVATTRLMQTTQVRHQISSMFTQEARDVFELTDKYLSFLSTTELENILPDTIFLHAFTGYLKSPNTELLDVMQQERGRGQFKEFYFITYSIMLCDQHRHQEATELLKGYGDDAPSSILNMRLHIAFMTKDVMEMVEVVKYAAENRSDIPDHLLPNFLAVINNMYGEVEQYAERLVISNPHSMKVYEQFLHFQRNEEVNIKYLKDNEIYFSSFLYPYIALIYAAKGNLDAAVAILEKCIDRKILDFRTSLLISYYRKDRKYSLQLYHLLHDLREAGNLDNELLRIELYMAENIQDYKEGLAISQVLVSRCSDDDFAITYHIKVLRSLNMVEQIKGYRKKLMNLNISSQYVRILSNIYLSIGEYYFVLDFLYRQIKLTDEQYLKDLYYTLHLNPDISKIIYEENSQVGIGDFVTIESEGKEFQVYASTGSVYEELVGNSKGKSLNIVQNAPHVVTIKSIHNKYYGLLVEIQEGIMLNNSQGIKAFSIDDFDFKNDPIAAISKMVGRPENYNEQQEKEREKYSLGELPLTAFVRDYDEPASMYNMLFDDKFQVFTLPNAYYDNLQDDDKKYLKQSNIVLDLSSLIMLYELSSRYGFESNSHFLVPISLQSLLKDTLVKEETSAPSLVYQSVIENITIKTKDECKSKLWNIVSGLLEWIDTHCKVVIVEEKLNLRDVIFKSRPILSVEIDSILLAQQGNVLLTEDWGWTRIYGNSFPVISVSNWLHFVHPQFDDDVAEFMVECGNLGYSLTTAYIKEQYSLLVNNEPNKFNLCMENVKVNPMNYHEILDAGKLILQDETITDKSKVDEMFIGVFRVLSPKDAYLLCYRESLKSNDAVYLRCLGNAFKTAHPQVIENIIGKQNE